MSSNKKKAAAKSGQPLSNRKKKKKSSGGSLLRFLLCGTGDAVSVDSLDNMTRQPNGEPVYDNVELKRYPIKLDELRDYIEQKSEDLGFKKEYNIIPWGLKFSHEVAKRSENSFKNRYANIIAYDHSRVKLKEKLDPHATDYINANYIDGYKNPCEYIATQGPVPLTVTDMWYMAWQEKSSIIVMVTNLIESANRKCTQYWPHESSQQNGDIKVSPVSTKCLAHYTIREFSLEKNGETRTLKQFHYTAWPDHGIPKHATPLLSFLKRVRQYKRPDDGPIICHCSAGVGRSGTFIALDALLQQAESEGQVDVFNYISMMRKQRCNMIQTLDQYSFLHSALLEAYYDGFYTVINIGDFEQELKKLQSRSNSTSKTSLLPLQTQFERIQEVLYKVPSVEGSATKNQERNRTSTVVPTDRRRVRLFNLPNDYINATYVDDHRRASSVIASQHPLPATISHFWSMVHSSSPVAVVTLCASETSMSDSNEEDDVPVFWPVQSSPCLERDSMSVKLIEESEKDMPSSVIRQSIVVSTSEQVMDTKLVEVDHYLCKFWSSSEALPSQMDSFISLIALIEKRKKESGDKTVIVNCVDGGTQTGLFLACHSLLQQIIMDGDVDVPTTVKLIKNDQHKFISTVEQYKFCYEFVRCFLNEYRIQEPTVFKSL